MADLCGEVYTRIRPGDLEPTHVLCTYIEGHKAHSWETLRVVDEAERMELDTARLDAPLDAPLDVMRVVLAIETGDWDRWLELILATAHDRKRTRRGVAGFPRRTT